MCRRLKPWAFLLFGTAAGILIGMLLPSKFLCVCLLLAAAAGGAALLRGQT